MTADSDAICVATGQPDAAVDRIERRCSIGDELDAGVGVEAGGMHVGRVGIRSATASTAFESGGRSYGTEVSSPMSTMRPSKPASHTPSAAFAPARLAPTMARGGDVPPPEVPRTDVIGSAQLRRTRRARERGGQPGQGDGTEEQAEVAERDVVVVAEHEQVDDDPGQPGGDEVAAEPGTDGDDEAGDDLGHSTASIAWWALPGTRSSIRGAR